MAPKQIDFALSLHATKTGGHQAREKVLELKDELKEFHNQAGNQVREDEKGCFGGAHNAWLRAGRPEERCVVTRMALIEGFATSEIQRMISTEIDDPDEGPEMMTEEAREEFLAFEMRLKLHQLSEEEKNIGWEWCKEHGEMKWDHEE